MSCKKHLNVYCTLIPTRPRCSISSREVECKFPVQITLCTQRYDVHCKEVKIIALTHFGH